MDIDLKLRIASWDEKTYRELPDGQKLARADVVLGGPGDELTGTFEGLLYYLPDGTSTYVTLTHLTGSLGGRVGSVALTGHGRFDGTAARGESRVVPGSGTGELSGITGTATSESTHEDYPFMPLTFSCQLP
jgi:hypothetical protein